MTVDSLDAAVLSHGHIDHSGWLKRLVNEGFHGPVYCSPATRYLAALMLPDSGRLREEEAGYANRKRYSTHEPALLLCTENDAVDALRSLLPLSYGEPRRIAPGMTLTFRRAGHILGSAVVVLDLPPKSVRRVR